MEGDWVQEICFTTDVQKMDAATAMEKADIAYGSWFPTDHEFDLHVAEAIHRNPKKQLINIISSRTNSLAFRSYIKNHNLVSERPEKLNYTAEKKPLPLSWLLFTDKGESSRVIVLQAPRIP